MNLICTVDKYIKETPTNAAFFKGIMILPIIGHVVQIWKRISLAHEYTAAYVKSQEVAKAFKKYEIKNFSEQSYSYSKISDVAMIICGAALIGSSNLLLSQILITAGCLSLFVRKFSKDLEN